MGGARRRGSDRRGSPPQRSLPGSPTRRSGCSRTAHPSYGWTSPSCSAAAAPTAIARRPVQPRRRGARTGTYPAPDRLDIIARAADIAAAIEPDLGRELFGQAVDVATGINDDAARLLAVHADLASRASLPVHDRRAFAVRLIRAVEAVAPHVTDPEVIPYAEIAGAAARLHPAAGLAAATRWDDQDRIATGIDAAGRADRRG